MRNLISAGALAALALSAVGGSASYGATTSSSDSCGTAAAGPVSTTSIPRPSPSIGGARGQSGTEINLGGRWRRLADSPFASDYPFGGWTGSVALVVDGPSGRTASYTPESDQWTELPSAPVRLNAGNEAPSVWTGDELLLWGNADDGTVGLGFTPSLSQWRVLGDSPLTGRVVSVTWTGGEVVAVADDASSAIYDPHRDCWSPLPPAPVAAGSGVRVYWSGDGVLADSRPVALAFLDARTGSWTRRGSDLLDRAADGGVYRRWHCRSLGGESRSWDRR